MKLAKIILPLVLPLAVLLTTGCPRHSTPPITKINKPVVSPNTPPPAPELPPAPPLEPISPQPVATTLPTNGIPTSDIDMSKYDQDRAALAAYTVHFKFDSATVEDAEQSHITTVAQALSDPNLRLLVEGHCDERGTEQYNLSLGERRALALREALAKLNVDPMHIKTVSYGKDKPVDPAHNEEAWSKNRRGEFVLLRPKTPAP